MSKKKDLPNHKIAILTSLLVDELDSLKPTSDKGQRVLSLGRELQEELMPVLDNLYTIEGVSKTTYLSDLANKVDTVIRKNYKKIEQ